MANFWAAACYAALALVPAAQAIAFEEPQATSVYDFDRRGGQQPPAPTNGPLLPRAIGRRTYSLSAGISYLTSTMGSEFCGYMSGQLDGGVFCKPGYDCIFHTPDAIYSGMVACCLEGGGSSACGFRSTCYNSDQISSTPGLLSYSDNTFVQLCTDNTAAECVTWTYPELGVTDFQCTDTNTVIWMSTWATGIVALGSGSVSGYSTGLLEVVPISTVGDAYINEHVTGAGKQPLSSAAPAGSTPTFDVVNNSTNSGGGSSVSGGAIAGAVVGSVVGVAGIGAALFMFFLMRRRKSQAAATAAASGDKTSGAMTQENGAAPAHLRFSQGNGTMLNPSEIDGYPTATGHRSDLSEVEGSSAIGSSNSPPVTEVEGNNTRPNIIQEMDARAEVLELPAEAHR